MSGAGVNPLMHRGSKVDLKVSGYNLPSLGVQPPAAFTVVFARNFGKSDWMEVSRSETLQSSDPQFIALFSMEYNFAIYQEVRIVVFDRSTQSNDLRQQRLIGVADTTLGRILSGRGKSVELPLTNVELGGAAGAVLVSAEAVLAGRKRVVLDLSVSELMSATETQAQEAYLAHLSASAGAPAPAAPRLARRGAAAARDLLGRLRKEGPPPPAALPAHLENVAHAQQQQRVAAQQRLSAAVTAPPPFAPYVVISRAASDAITERDYYNSAIPWEPVYRSAPVSDHLSEPAGFQGISIGIHELCDGSEHRLLKFSVHRSGGAQPDSVIGETPTTLYALRKLAGSTITGAPQVLDMRPVGRLHVTAYAEEEESSFVDYVQSGRADFSLICAIDFTSSNGDPFLPGTCHHIAPPGAPPAPNQYEAAMRAVGNILASYSTNTKVEAFGFGANLPPTFEASFCFNVSETIHGDACDGVDGLVRAYKHTLGRVQLAGPTIFSNVLQTAGTITSRRMEAAARSASGILPYSILLILTDGVISDFDASLAQLIALSALPISVIIVGIGNEDFRKMRQLDQGERLRRGTTLAQRDIVQFVPFRDFRGDPAALAEAVLSRLPDQVMSYVTEVQSQGQ